MMKNTTFHEKWPKTSLLFRPFMDIVTVRNTQRTNMIINPFDGISYREECSFKCAHGRGPALAL